MSATNAEQSRINRDLSWFHMEGWECFGCTDKPDERTLRRIGDLPPPLKGYDGKKDKWPKDEVHNGVAHVEIHAHADNTRGAYLCVQGPQKAAVEACWKRVARTIPLAVWWAEPTGGSDE